MLLVDEPLTNSEHALLRKHFDHKYHGGPKLTRAERQRVARFDKREARKLWSDFSVFMLIFVPLAWLVVSRAH